MISHLLVFYKKIAKKMHIKMHINVMNIDKTIK